jgi:alpha-1,3-rhamnosyl/mannosyltransferase
MWLGARRASLVVTDSEHSKRDICRSLNVAPDRVIAIPIGVEPAFCPVRDAARLDAARRRYQLPERFILHVGSFLRHKNLPTLLRAFAQLPPSLRACRHIVLAGTLGRNAQAVRQTVRELGLDDQVVWPGRVANDDLPSFYSMAELFVMPSLYAGFGLPVLEAMACGAPVIAADSTSLPEVVADAGLLVDGRNVTAMSRAMERVLTDRALRARLVEAGLSRAARFTWQETARRTQDAYHRACEE